MINATIRYTIIAIIGIRILQYDETISVIIGPEGGFSDSEAERAKESGLSLVGLGKRILRTETVSSAVLAMIMYENGEV